MKMKIKLAVALAIATLVLIPIIASATSVIPAATVNAEASGIKLFGLFGNPQIPYGQYIKVTVKVRNTGVIAFEPKIKILITDPYGMTYTKQYDNLGSIAPGQEKQWTFQTGVQANRVGTWHLNAELWDKATNERLSSDTAQFDVVKAVGNIQIVNVTGYSAASLGIIAASWYLIRRHFGVA